MPNGNWVIGEMADAPRADGFEWGFMALPAMEEGGDRYSYTFFEQCWIPAGAENKDLAKVFMSLPVQRRGRRRSLRLPVLRPPFSPSPA